MKARNGILVILVCLFLVGPALLFGAERAGIELPSWFTAEEAKYWEGAQEDAVLLENLNFDGFRSKELQSNMEKAITGHIPCKVTAMLDNAALQRGSIAASNLLFDWECYPTYYGSGYVVLPAQEALMAMPLKRTPEVDEDLDSFFDALEATAKANPDLDFCLYMATGLATPPVSPLYSLVSNVLTYDDAVAMAEGRDQNIPNLSLVFSDYDSIEDFFADYYKTDHHWAIGGTIEGYEGIVEATGLPYIDYAAMGRQFIEESVGSLSRSSLTPLAEDVYDVVCDFPGVVGYDDETGEPMDPATHERFYDADPLEQRLNFYGAYVTDMPKYLTGPGDEDVLLVMDSYGDSLKRLLASASSTLRVSTAFAWDRENFTDLADFAATHDDGTVIMVSDVEDIISFQRRNPNFLVNVG